MSASMIQRINVAANSTTDNVVRSAPNEVLEQPALVQLLAMVDAPEVYDIQATFQLGNINYLLPPWAQVWPIGVHEYGTPNNEAVGAIKAPNDQYHWMCAAIGNAGDNIYLTFTNGGGTARNVHYIIRLGAV